MPMTTENRMTTKVVAYTSLRLGHVTRPISLRTSERNRRDRPHHPVTLSRARPPNESSGSAATVFIFYLAGVPCTPATSFSCWQDRRESNPQPPVLETGGLFLALASCRRSLCPLHSLSPSSARSFPPPVWPRLLLSPVVSTWQ